MHPVIWILLILVFSAAAGAAGYMYRKDMVEKKINRSEETARRLYDDAVRKAEGDILEKQEVIPMNDNHKESVIKGTPSTCTVDGKTDGVECSLCKKILEPQATLPKLPHTEKIVKGVPATCENEGLTDGISCAVCSFEIEKQELFIAQLDSQIEVSAADYQELTRLLAQKEDAENLLMEFMEQWEALQ